MTDKIVLFCNFTVKALGISLIATSIVFFYNTILYSYPVSKNILRVSILFKDNNRVREVSEICHKAGEPQAVIAENISDYRNDDLLGRDIEVFLILKGVHQDEIVKKVIERKSKNFGLTGASKPSERRYSDDGGIFAINLNRDSFNAEALISSGIKIRCPEPFSMAFSGGNKIAYTAGYELIVQDVDTRERKIITHPWISFLHTVDFSEDGKRVLVSSAGFDIILEFEIDSGRVLWEWNTWDHGYNKAITGEYYVTREEKVASELKQAGKEVIFVKNPEDWPKEGLPTQQSPTRLNGAHYGKNGIILATCYHTGELLKIIKKDGSFKKINLKLNHPHSFSKAQLPYHKGYIAADTGNGKILFLDDNFKVIRIIDFSTLQADKAKKDGFGEWLQYVSVIDSERGVLAVIDALRDGVHVIDPDKKVRRFIRNPPKWTIQALVEKPKGVKNIKDLNCDYFNSYDKSNLLGKAL